jgi:hypothetical protein
VSGARAATLRRLGEPLETTVALRDRDGAALRFD